ncbi:MAG: hypothetical protein ABSA75_01615 [Candidatus Bathyarchaeia archaeon]
MPLRLCDCITATTTVPTLTSTSTPRNFCKTWPEGYHDDCVVAFALAAWQLKHTPPITGVGVAVIKKKTINRVDD